MIYCFILSINGVKIFKRIRKVAADQMLFMTVENNKDLYSDLLIIRDRRDHCTLLFLQEKENLASIIIYIN